MIRNFSFDDITKFPNIKIKTHTKKNGIQKDYLMIERPPFISAFITINEEFTILIEQYRPIISQHTLEIPMGKIEPTDLSPKDAMIRELQEECNIFITEPTGYLMLKHKISQHQKKIPFSQLCIHQEKDIYLSPGFSTSKQYPFILSLTTKENISLLLENYQFFSQEEELIVHCKKISTNLRDELDGLSCYALINYLYKK